MEWNEEFQSPRGRLPIIKLFASGFGIYIKTQEVVVMKSNSVVGKKVLKKNQVMREDRKIKIQAST